MFKLSVIHSFVWLIGQVWSISLICLLDEQGELGEAANNTLNDSEHFNDTTNPEELGTYFEGDILITEQELIMKNELISRWPKGRVPYEIPGKFNAKAMALIENAFNEFHRYTCIRFVPRTTEQHYISIESGNSGCWSSSVGRAGGQQKINLQYPRCLTKIGTTLHELMHAVGFHHEQNRVDRDTFVSIKYENLLPKALFYFGKKPEAFTFGVPYDYGSVMHYTARAFSINGKPTIIPKKDLGKTQMGQRNGFSASDIVKLNGMYECGNAASSALAPASISAPNA